VYISISNGWMDRDIDGEVTAIERIEGMSLVDGKR